MKEYSKPYLVLIILASWGSLIISPAFAQSNGNNQPTRSVRVTTGVEAVQGWEQGLVKTNPNLARWHWDPIYSYTQGYTKLPVPSARPDNAQSNRPFSKYPTSNYSGVSHPDDRPNHIPFSSKAMEEVRKNHILPVIPAPVAQARHDEHVSGQLFKRPKEAPVAEPAAGPILATYGNLYSRKENLGTSLNYSSQRADVYGQLLNTKEKSRYNGAKTVQKKHVN